MPMVAPSMWRESNQPSLQENQGGSLRPPLDEFEFRFWSGARDLNPGPHGPEPARWRVLLRPVVSARFLLYSKWIFFVSSCDLVYPPGSVNA